MTTPKINTIHRGSSRYYVHPDTGAKVPGVTSVINMLPKPFLKPWGQKLVAQYAVDNLGSIVSIVLNGDRQGAIDYLKRAPERSTAASAELGTLAHGAFESLAKGESPKVSPDVAPFAALFTRFLTDMKPDIKYQEETVWSEKHDYMGSFDGYGEINGVPAYFDWKTTRSGVHAEVALQLAAYRFSDYLIRSDGTTIETPPAQGGIVVHVRPEALQVWEVDIDEDVFSYFLALRKTFRWVDGKDREVLAAKPAYSVDYDAILADQKPVRRRRAAS